MESPMIERSVVLELIGDWGFANLHRSCGWIASQVVARSGAGSRAAVWTGDGWVANVRAVADRTVDAGFVTPASLARLATEGRGPFEGRPLPQLRALGVVPQFDRLVFAVRRDFDVASFAELRAKRPPLRISIPETAREDLVGYAARLLLEAEGVGQAELESWGGRYVTFEDLPVWAREHNSPFAYLARVRKGEADAVIFEAMMLPDWQELAVDPGLVFLPVGEEALARIEATTGWPRATVPAGYYPGQAEAFETLDFADFLLICRDDMPEDLAHLIAYCMGETKQILERQYAHLPPERSPVTYPLDPIKMGLAPIALHPGAQRYYESLGVAVG